MKKNWGWIVLVLVYVVSLVMFLMSGAASVYKVAFWVSHIFVLISLLDDEGDTNTAVILGFSVAYFFSFALIMSLPMNPRWAVLPFAIAGLINLFITEKANKSVKDESNANVIVYVHILMIVLFYYYAV